MPLIAPVPAQAPASLTALLATFHKWLHLPDEDSLLVILAAVVANRVEGDPVWLLVVGSPGTGKTEMLQPLAALADVHPAATLTEAALLSGSPRKDKARDATGGLLRQIGERGIILCKDFGSILSMHRDARAAVMAALREIYDGFWTRHLGVDGGRTLEWQGRVGFIAGCTPTIDGHHAVMASLGERFVLLRLRNVTTTAYARKALQHAGKEATMRRELAAAVAGFLAGVTVPEAAADLSPKEVDDLVNLGLLVCQCRSAVERNPYHREIELVPGVESPTRFSVTLLRLFTGLVAIGVDRDRSWRLVRRVALDSMPALRCAALKTLLRLGASGAGTIATAMDFPTTTTRRTLQDLAAHHVVCRTKTSGDDIWQLDEDAEVLLKTFPEMSEGSVAAAGTVPEMSEGSVEEVLGRW